MYKIQRQIDPHRKISDHDFIMMSHLRPQIIRSLQRTRGTVLDIGCGYKPYLPYVPKNVFYIGSDIDSISSLPDIICDVQNLSFKNDSFDCVVGFEVLEHIAEPDIAFRNIYRVLKPDGLLILTTPQSWRIHEAPNDFFRYTKFGLEYLAKKNYFHVGGINPIGSGWSKVGQTLISMLPHQQLGPFLRPINILINIFTIIAEYFWKDYKDPLGNIIEAKK